MPTGYTAGILDGSITTFKQFAETCLRAFLPHMRDENFNSPIKMRQPSHYHANELSRLERELNTLNKRSDDWLIDDERLRIEDEIDRINRLIKKRESDRAIMEDFLNKATSYMPPTENHKEIKKFMIDQLKGTIDFDCKDSGGYYDNKLVEMQEELKKLNPQLIRAKRMKKLTDDVLYHTEENQKEIDWCIETNEWIEKHMQSLKDFNP